MYYSNELYHYGTKGQKWGQRNYQNEDGSYTSKGKAENNGHGRYSTAKGIQRIKDIFKTSKKNLYVSEKDYEALINKSNNKITYKDVVNSPYFEIGLVVAGAALFGYGMYKIDHMNQSNNNNILSIDDDLKQNLKPFNRPTYMRTAIEVSIKDFNDRPDLIDDLESLKENMIDPSTLVNDNDIYEKLLKNNNASVFDKYNIVDYYMNPVLFLKNKTKEEKDALLKACDTRTNNCMLCTTNLVMRMKGYKNTIAAESPSGWYAENIEKMFKNAKTMAYVGDNKDALLKSLSNQGEGHYGNFMVFWKNGGGHSIFYTIKDGVPKFIDGQTEQIYKTDELFSKIEISKTQFIDLTNCEPTDLVKKAIMMA